MITKEVAARIHNCYTQIESGRAMLEEMKNLVNDKGEMELAKDWTGSSRGLELHIPNKSGGHRIKTVPLDLGLEIINRHIKNKEAELKEIKSICKTQLA